jgi:UDP-N-acetylmuramyl pentapeptide phosphotransferase/UDP-N-acetylglucosamine-1-phosphate transferase
VTAPADVAFLVAGVFFASLILSIASISLLLPWLRTFALARPNARSVHREPTPQGGGLGVIVAAFGTVWCVTLLMGALSTADVWQLFVITTAVALLTAVGLLDDIHSLSLLSRLLVQCIAVGIVVIALPVQVRATAELPLWIERAVMFVGGVWFVNLVNFMDGIDWMTVAEVVPVTGAILLFGILGILPAVPLLIAAALLGAVTGFAPFNK